MPWNKIPALSLTKESLLHNNLGAIRRERKNHSVCPCYSHHYNFFPGSILTLNLFSLRVKKGNSLLFSKIILKMKKKYSLYHQVTLNYFHCCPSKLFRCNHILQNVTYSHILAKEECWICSHLTLGAWLPRDSGVHLTTLIQLSSAFFPCSLSDIPPS